MRVIVYLPVADERALTLDGHDPAQWVRDAVKAALSERVGHGAQGDPGTASGSITTPHAHETPARSESVDVKLTRATHQAFAEMEVKPDPKPTAAEKKKRR